MATFVSLIHWTDQGIAGYKESSDRAARAGNLARKHGGALTAIYWTVGPYDLVAILDMPDVESLTAFALEISSLGSVRTTSMRAFTDEEFTRIVARTG